MTVYELEQRHTSLMDEVRAIHAAPAGEGNDLSADQENDLAALQGKVVNLEKRIAAQKFVDARDKATPGRPLNGTSQSRPELRVFASVATTAPDTFDGSVMIAQNGSRVPVLEARHKFADFAPAEQRGPSMSFGGFLRALYFGPTTDDERRALAESTIGTGGAFVPTPLAAQIIDALRAKAVAFRAGARTVPMTSQTERFGRVLSTPVGAWRPENAPIVEDQPAFDQVTLTAKTWALQIKISRELVEDGQNTDSVLQQAFSASAALALDRAIIWGSGQNNEPLGVANSPGIQTISMGPNGAKFTNWVPVLDAVAALEGANAGTVSAMVASPRTGRSINGLVDTLGQPLSVPPRLAGIPLLTTTSASVTETQGTNSASSSIILGDFSEVYVGIRTALQISVLNERYADTGQIAFVAWLRADVLVARPAAMARIVGVTA